eukprot:364655-Chlamydomonas_euryale.AAC.5
MDTPRGHTAWTHSVDTAWTHSVDSQCGHSVDAAWTYAVWIHRHVCSLEHTHGQTHPHSCSRTTAHRKCGCLLAKQANKLRHPRPHLSAHPALQDMRRSEAQNRAVVLEMIGDLPEADAAPPSNYLFVCKLNPVRPISLSLCRLKAQRLAGLKGGQVEQGLPRGGNATKRPSGGLELPRLGWESLTSLSCRIGCGPPSGCRGGAPLVGCRGSTSLAGCRGCGSLAGCRGCLCPAARHPSLPPCIAHHKGSDVPPPLRPHLPAVAACSMQREQDFRNPGMGFWLPTACNQKLNKTATMTGSKHAGKASGRHPLTTKNSIRQQQ